MIFDFCVIGAGIVGLSTALNLLRQRPGASILILEKEPRIAQHQTGHNSGVIHSGIYYTPGSLKADLCRRGAQATKEFCAEHDIPVRTQGKLLVATTEQDLQRLADLEERSKINNIEAERLSAAELQELEPQVAGLGALLVPATGSVDYGRVSEAMRGEIEQAGGLVRLGVQVDGIFESLSEVTISSGDERWTARQLVVCGGLQADRLARLAGLASAARIVPFRGEYFRLPDHRRTIVSHLIYPVPDPALPFLGVHLTPMVDGTVTLGPNAVLGLSREGYRKGALSVADIRDILGFAGFWRVARKHARTGVVEVRNSLFRRGYLAACRRYCPSLELSDLLPYEAGIRAQAVLPDGTLVHDFVFEQTDRMLHVLNAPSPAATSALPIGEMIADRCLALRR
nr:L-2-hydroxyglutarate oxidase [Microlunatus panaciterrae]